MTAARKIGIESCDNAAGGSVREVDLSSAQAPCIRQ